jgi:YbbR domain-containing protein
MMGVLKKFDDFLAYPVVLWVISLAIAVSLWFYSMDQGAAGNEQRRFLVRVSYKNLAPQLSLRNSVQEAEVDVEASEAVMSRLRHDDIACEVDLRDLSSGRYRLATRIVLPQRVRVVSVTPSMIDVELIRQAGRVFGVGVTLPRDIPAGRYLEAVEIVPKEVSVKGSEKDLAKIGAVNVAPTLRELEDGKQLLLPAIIAQSEPFEDEVAVEPPQVRMNATLATGLPRKKAAVNVRLSGKPHEDYAVRSVTTDPAEVMVQGAQDRLASVSAADTETVDITGISSDQTIAVPLRPLGVRGVSVADVKSVNLLVQLEPIVAQKRLSGIPVAVEGVTGGFSGSGGPAPESGGKKPAERPAGKWVVDPGVVDVILEASPSRMAGSDPESLGLKVFVDMSNIFLRRTVLPVRAVVSADDFRIVRIEPPTVIAAEVGE